MPVIPEGLLRHRGPDHTAEAVFGNVAVRHWRLSIVDLSHHSDQPITDDVGFFVYNGELYDYAALGARFGFAEQGDTRTFLALLDKTGGYEAIHQASGFYAFLRYSQCEKTLIGGRDNLGKKPLLYYVDDSIAVFASEECAILPFLPKVEVDSQALGEYLLYKNRFFGNTYVRGVRELAPGASFSFDVGAWKLTESQRWDEYYASSLLADYCPAGGASAEDSVEALEAACRMQLQAAVARRLKCDVPTQIALSGGADSAAIAALAVHAGVGEVLRAVTVQFSEGLDETERARLVAGQLKLRHQAVPFDSAAMLAQIRNAVRAMTSPLDHPHALAYLRMCEEVRREGKVLLTGEGADELFFGYRHYESFGVESFAFREYLKPEDEALFSTSRHGAAFAAIRESAGFDALRKLALGSAVASRELEFKTHLLSLLRRNDNMSMAYSVEIRAPFLDPALRVLALAGPARTRLQRGKQFVRQIVHDHLPELPPFDAKNGFRIPFDENYAQLARSEEGGHWLHTARTALAGDLGLSLDPACAPSPRLGWSLLNIGCFLDEMQSRVQNLSS
jgi:asparagine synthase (glutamine-hydrolysing)